MPVIRCQPLAAALVACISAVSWAVPLWQSNAAYQVNDVVSYAGQDYRALQNHIANANWAPNRSAAFWLELGASTQAVSPNHAPVLASEKNTIAMPTAAVRTDSALVNGAIVSVSTAPMRTPVPKQNGVQSVAAVRTSIAGAESAAVAVVLCASAWTSGTAYAQGALVTLNGRNFQATATNSNQSPIPKKKTWWKFWKRQKSNQWNDIGACNSSMTTPSPAPAGGLITPAATPVSTPVPQVSVVPSPAITPAATPVSTRAPQVSAVPSPVPNANTAQWLSAPTLGFYDTTANGQLRAVRNDLAGGLLGI